MNPSAADERVPPDQRVTINQVVAWNMAWFRKAAGLTQAELGERIGRTGGEVSAAERSWDGKRVREFDAQALITIAQALGVPLTALFLPPDDDGEHARYTWAHSASGNEQDMADLAMRILNDNGDQTPVMNAYRQRLIDTAAVYLQPDWGDVALEWMSAATAEGMRETLLDRLQFHYDALAAAAEDIRQIRRALEGKP